MSEEPGAMEVRFAVGQTVLRQEEKRTAVILELYPLESYEEPLYLLGYEEGGEGVWPQSGLTAVTTATG
jgi:hypothetical protein